MQRVGSIILQIHCDHETCQVTCFFDPRPGIFANDAGNLGSIGAVTGGRSCRSDIPKALAEQAEDAKKGCPVSRVLAGVEISLEAKLERDVSTVEKREEDLRKAPADARREKGTSE